MTANQLTKAGACFALFFVALSALYLRNRAATKAQSPSSLEEFFNTVLRNPSTLPKFDDLHRVTAGIADARPQDIRRALPAISTALAQNNEQVKAPACTALFAIAGRSDGAELLKTRIGTIGEDLLTSPFENIQAGEVVILGRLRPTPPKVVPLLLTFVKQADRNSNVQGGAIFELVQIAPENPEVIAAIEDYLSRQLDSSARIGVLNALGNPNVKDTQLIAMIGASMNDPTPG